MAEAYRCDRCDHFDDGKPVMRVTFEPIHGTSGTRRYELCPPCLSELVTFMDLDEENTDA